MRTLKPTWVPYKLFTVHFMVTFPSKIHLAVVSELSDALHHQIMAHEEFFFPGYHFIDKTRLQ